jgi:DNA-binding transcriptional regulator PaaX
MLRGKSLTKEILFMTAVSPIILSCLFLPNAAQILKPLLKWHKNWDETSRSSIHNAIKRLNQKRLIKLRQKGNELYIEITDKGKTAIKNFDFENLELPQLKAWDKMWRMVIFDVPDKKQKERRALSEKLKNLGFYPLQESVFVYPYDCRDEIDFVCEFLSISRYVNYCVVADIDKKEGDLRYFFDLI